MVTLLKSGFLATLILLLVCSQKGSAQRRKPSINFNVNVHDHVIPQAELDAAAAVAQKSSMNDRDVINYFGNPKILTNSSSAANSMGDYALIAAATSGDTGLVNRLLDCGARVNAVNQDNSTALILASRYGKTETVQVLLDRGANINLTDIYGYSAIVAAAEKGSVEKVELLIQRGANIEQRIKSGNDTALMVASITNQSPVIAKLAQYGADVNARDGSNSTAIILAARLNNKAAVHMLRSLNATTSDCLYPICDGIYF